MGWASPLWGSSWGMPGHRKAVWGGESVICFDRKVRRLQTTSWSHENERIQDTQNTAKLGLGYIMTYRWATQTHPSKIKMNLTFGIWSTARVWEQTVCVLKYMHAHVHRLEQWTFHFFLQWTLHTSIARYRRYFKYFTIRLQTKEQPPQVNLPLQIGKYAELFKICQFGCCHESVYFSSYSCLRLV